MEVGELRCPSCDPVSSGACVSESSLAEDDCSYHQRQAGESGKHIMRCRRLLLDADPEAEAPFFTILVHNWLDDCFDAFIGRANISAHQSFCAI